MAWKMDLEGFMVDMGFRVSNTRLNPVTTGTEKYGGGGGGRGGG